MYDGKRITQEDLQACMDKHHLWLNPNVYFHNDCGCVLGITAFDLTGQRVMVDEDVYDTLIKDGYNPSYLVGIDNGFSDTFPGTIFGDVLPSILDDVIECDEDAFEAGVADGNTIYAAYFEDGGEGN
jgi:hypothetical protein